MLELPSVAATPCKAMFSSADRPPRTPAQNTVNMGRGAKEKKKGDLNELKQELELDVHKVSPEELCRRFKTDLTRGLTDAQVR